MHTFGFSEIRVFLDLDLFLWVTLNPCLIMDRVLALCCAELTHLLSCTCFGIPTLQDMSLVNWSILTRFSSNLLASPSWNSGIVLLPKIWISATEVYEHFWKSWLLFAICWIAVNDVEVQLWCLNCQIMRICGYILQLNVKSEVIVRGTSRKMN